MTDEDLFKKLLGKDSVKPIVTDDISPDFYPKKPDVSRQKRQLAESFEHAAISQENYCIGIEDPIEFRRDGIQKQLFKQLAKGEIPIDEHIDLHGMTTMEAEIYMSMTIDNLHFAHMSCLKIVHGKGYNAGDSINNKPVPKLKNFTARYLSEHLRVLAFTSCPQNRGGTGAVYVLLSRSQ